MAKLDRATRKKNRNGGLNTTYLTKMGVRNVFSNSTMSLSSISVLTACLLLIGVSFILVFNIRNLVNDVESQNVVVVFVEDNIERGAVEQVGNDLRAIENVTDVDYVSKEEGFNEQLNEFGVDRDLLEGVIENPLPDSFRVTVSNIALFDETLAKIKKVPNVNAVRESQ